MAALGLTLSKPVVVSDRAALLLKLAAFVVMVADHLDMFGFTAWGVHATVGRLVFPVFGALFAFNLQRMISRGIEAVIVRLAVWGAVAQVAYSQLQVAAVPLNIFFTLALAAVLYVSIREGAWFGVLVALLASLFVDYAVFGVLPIALLAIALERRSRFYAFLGVVGFAVALTPINGNLWALLSVPVLAIACEIHGSAPRLKRLFWWGYPLHLFALLAWRVWA